MGTIDFHPDLFIALLSMMDLKKAWMLRCLLHTGGFQRKSDGVNTLFYIYLHNMKGVHEIALAFSYFQTMGV